MRSAKGAARLPGRRLALPGASATSSGLDGKIALVTGGSSGVGLAVVRRLLDEGARVMTCARHAGRLEAALGALAAAHGDRLVWQVADVGRGGDIEQLFRSLSERWGGIDILVNNAAGAEAGRLETLSDAQWQVEFDTKLMAMVRTVRLAVPLMRERGGGSIVNINAVFAQRPHPDFFASSVVRAGCLALTRLLAADHARDGIRANAVGLGVVATEAWRAWYDSAASSYEDFLAASAAHYRVPMARMALPEEIADAVAYLAGPRAAYVTGTQFDVDGGLSVAN